MSSGALGAGVSNLFYWPEIAAFLLRQCVKDGPPLLDTTRAKVEQARSRGGNRRPQDRVVLSGIHKSSTEGGEASA